MRNIRFTNITSLSIDNGVIYSYCGNCLSDNMEMDENGFYFKIDENGKCKCLDCRWAGTRYECKNMTLQERKKLN